MRFLNKLCILATVAYVSASPKIEHRAEGQAGYDWSKFLGKVPEYFKTPEGLNQFEQSSLAESNSDSQIQHDSSYSGGGFNPSQISSGSFNPSQFSSGNFNPSQLSSSDWNQKFRSCMNGWSQRIPSNQDSSYSSGSSSGSSSSSGGYNIQNAEAYQQGFEKCRKEVSQNFGNPGQDYQSYFQGFHIPQELSNYGASSASSSSSST